ncbi:MAG: FliH/SctL family protein [Candidatus Eremiobacteraeota bacterium]|nr:FliH/SctL family protein [Candidatus Eremiobacteraeota bacterium]
MDPAAWGQGGTGAGVASGVDQEAASQSCGCGAAGDYQYAQAELCREAIALAEIACSRMLARALAEDDRRTIESFVADALAAAGSQGPFETRLNPRDAALVAARYDPIADPALTRGSVVVSTPAGTLRADMNARAGLLVRAAAHKR